MASTSANPELAGALSAAGRASVTPSGRLRVALLRLFARLEGEPIVRVALAIAVVAAGAALWLAAVVLHELLVLASAVVLPSLTAVPVIQTVLAELPLNYIYASAAVRYAGQIEPSGVAIAGELGVTMVNLAPGIFYDPSYVAGDGPLSAVIGPGSSIMAQVLASSAANLMVLAIGVWIVVRSLRGSRAESLVGIGLARWLGVAAGMVVQLEVAFRVLRTAGSIRDLETLGVLPFIFHNLLRLHRSQYDAALARASRLIDPIFSEVVLAGLYAVVGLGVVTWLLVRRARREGARSLVNRRALDRLLARAEPGPARLAVDASLVVVLLAALPLASFLETRTRFLEWEGAPSQLEMALMPIPAVVELSRAEGGAPPAALDIPSTPPVALPQPVIPSLAPSGPVILAPPAVASVPAKPAAAAPAKPAVAPLGPARPSVVSIGGRGYHFTYTVNGELSEFRGMGYNVTHAGLPAAERAERLRRDFQLMRESGVNTIVGWRTPEWDESVLAAAHAAGIGVVMPYDLDDKLDYSDRVVRFKVRSDVLAWVDRYRNHPAIRMWGLGNETMLHLKQVARARAFADFYVGLVEIVRQYDPTHPVLYREAEDVYIRPLQDAWAPRGGPPHGFVLGMNFYTFRMRDALDNWPKKGMDVPIVVSEFAPAGLGRGDRAAGYWRMWGMIRGKPDYVLGAAPYVWNVEGPEPVDRLFGLVDPAGKPVDSALGTLRDMYSLPLTSESGPDVGMPGLLGMRLADVERVVAARGLKLAIVTRQHAGELKDAWPVRFYGIGNVIHQEPDPGARVPRGGEVRVAIASALPAPEPPRARPRAE